MDYLEVLKVFRPFYGKNQKYYSEIHPILYYNDEIYTNPFLQNNENIKEEHNKKNYEIISKYLNNYKIGFNRNNFFKLFLRILREKNFKLSFDEVLRQMIYDFDSLNLFKEYGLRQYKYKRDNVRNSILNKEFDKMEFIQFCADYFSFVIHLINDQMYIFYPRNDKSIRAPKLYIYQDVIYQSYYHIKVNDKLWVEQKYIKEKIQEEKIQEEKIQEEKKEPMYDCSKLIKMKVVELRDIAKELNIDIQKLNDRKTRMINKKKSELITEIIEKV